MDKIIRSPHIKLKRNYNLIKITVIVFLLILSKNFLDVLIGSVFTNILIVFIFLHFTFGIKRSFRALDRIVRYILQKPIKIFNKSAGWFTFAFLALLIFFLTFMVITIDQQSSEINTLHQKINLIEKKFGGSEKLNCNEKDTVDKVRRSVVRIIGGEGEGSGFAIQEGGYILTNFHVIEFEPTPKVVFPDNSFDTAEIIMADKNADLAILKVNKDLPIVSWGVPEELNPAEELLAIGFPMGGQLTGEASVNKGAFAGRRRSKDVGVEYIQTDITLTGGVSGGPMVNVCGEVEGINTSGLAGLGLAISTTSIRQKMTEMINTKEDVLKDIQRITFDPNAGSLDTVRAFYNYLKARKLDKAFELLSDNFKKGYSFNNWKKGYEPLLDTTVINIIEDPKIKNRINIKLSTKDMVDGEIVYKYFEGYWDVKEFVNKWQLWEPKIKEVKEPDYMWFYE